MKKYMSALLLAAFLCACSGVKVLNAEVADNTDLKQYKTFDFYNVKASGDTLSNMFNERIVMLKEAIGTELTQRGYVQSAN
jgi:hypothetical protein